MSPYFTGTTKAIVKKLLGMDREYDRITEAVLRLLRRVPAAAELLDAGCGDGQATMEYARALSVPAAGIHGVDTGGGYLRGAARTFDAREADLEKAPLPWGDQYFDIVICNQVLEHLKNIFSVLTEMDRTVKTGGYLLLGIPNLAGLHNRLLLLLGRQPVCNIITGPHLRCFAHRDFMDFLARNGNFELAATDSASLYPLPYPLVDWLGRVLPGFSAYTFYLLKKVRHSPADCGWNIKKVGDTYFS